MAGGIAPPALSEPYVKVSGHTAPTIRSYGSDHLPVGKELRFACEHVRQELPGPLAVAPESFVLPHRPAHQINVDAL